MAYPSLPAWFKARNTGNGSVQFLYDAVPADATQVDVFDAVPTNEVQQVVIDATGGTFTVTYSGQTTSALAFDITAAAFQTAMEALSNIAVGDITVTEPTNGTYVLSFSGLLGYANLAQVTTNATLLTGGAATATPSTVTGGVGFYVDNIANGELDTTITNGQVKNYYLASYSSTTGYSDGYLGPVRAQRADAVSTQGAAKVNVVQSVPVPTA